MFKEFRDFIFKGNVVDLAVGIVIGAAFGALVTSLVENLIMPIPALLFGQPNFDALQFTIGSTVFGYGKFLTVLISFLSIALAVFFFVIKPLNGALKRMGVYKEPTEMADCPSCLQSIPAAAKKCMYCTVDLTPGG